MPRPDITLATADEVCECGHVYDEHNNGRGCTVYPDDNDGYRCPCVHFDLAE